MIYAVIPAAGQSRRMGRPKLTLPLGTTTVIGAVIGTLRDAGVDRIVVVVGPESRELESLSTSAGANVCALPTETEDMRSTVEHGLRWLEANNRPKEDDAWFLVPGDHPTIEGKTIRMLIQARDNQPNYSIWLPTYLGERGHPALIAWKHVAGLRNVPPAHGINTYLRQHVGQVAEVPLATDSILCDLDVPEDYERLARHY